MYTIINYYFPMKSFETEREGRGGREGGEGGEGERQQRLKGVIVNDIHLLSPPILNTMTIHRHTHTHLVNGYILCNIPFPILGKME